MGGSTGYNGDRYTVILEDRASLGHGRKRRRGQAVDRGAPGS